MFSFFSKPDSPSSSRFHSCKKLKQLFPHLTALRHKEYQLRQAAEVKGAGSIDFRKHCVIARLLAQIDIKIQNFNEGPIATNPKDEMKHIIQLVQELAEIVKNTFSGYKKTIMGARNFQRAAVNAGVDVGFITGAAAASVIFSLPVLVSLFTIFCVMPDISKKTRNITGLSSDISDSARILMDLSDTLMNIGIDLGLANNWNMEIGFKDNDDCPDEYLCPIKGEIMLNPVICTLDERTYERDAIEYWLTEHRTAPYNRAPLRFDQPIESVLVRDRNLKDLIDKYLANHPQQIKANGC